MVHRSGLALSNGTGVPASAEQRVRTLESLAGRNPSLRRLSAETLTWLVQLCRLRTVMRGTPLSNQGDRPHTLWLVAEGRLVLQVESSGRTRELDEVRAGGAAGLLGLVMQSPLPYGVVAADHSCVLEVDLRALHRLCAAFHPHAIELVTAFTPELVDVLRKLEQRAVRVASHKRRPSQLMRVPSL